MNLDKSDGFQARGNSGFELRTADGKVALTVEGNGVVSIPKLHAEAVADVRAQVLDTKDAISKLKIDVGETSMETFAMREELKTPKFDESRRGRLELLSLGQKLDTLFEMLENTNKSVAFLGNKVSSLEAKVNRL